MNSLISGALHILAPTLNLLCVTGTMSCLHEVQTSQW